MWKEQNLVTVKSFSKNHIDLEINSKGKIWRFTGIYGHPKTNNKHLTWDLMRRLKDHNDSPWLLGGDFNEIINDMEKVGGPKRKRKYMEDFRRAKMAVNSELLIQ